MTLFHLWDLPGDVLAAPESASGLDRCNLSLSLSLSHVYTFNLQRGSHRGLRTVGCCPTPSLSETSAASKLQNYFKITEGGLNLPNFLVEPVTNQPFSGFAHNESGKLSGRTLHDFTSAALSTLLVGRSMVDWARGRGPWAGPARPVVNTTAWAGEPHNDLNASSRGIFVEPITNLEKRGLKVRPSTFGPIF